MSSNSVEAALSEGLVARVAPDGVETRIKANFDDPGAPARMLSFTVYRTGRNPGQRLDRYTLQVMARGLADDSLDADELLGPIADQLAGLTHIDVGGTEVVQVLFRSSIPLGIDSKNRPMRSDTFDLDVVPPATSDRPY